ncbi:MAG: hypothetical protein L3J43_01440 [Sulfurovum sp.]|nr:hypothetical protein [Sulfurovum sp.]
MNTSIRLIYPIFIWFLIGTFTLFYPMLISIYVFLPLFIGIVGYVFILGVEQGKWHYVLLSMVYLINLEVNLSLPFFLMLLSSLVVYAVFYTKLAQVKRCKICIKMMLVLLLDLVYLGSLIGYDFIFQSSSIMLDKILAYSLIIDMLVVMVL